MVHHLGEGGWGCGSADAVQAVDDGGEGEGGVAYFCGLVFALGPEKGDGFGEVADIVAAHFEEDGVGAGADHLSDGGGFDGFYVEIAG